MPQKKSLNNRQRLAKLIKEADEMTLVFLRERLLYIADLYPDNQETRNELKNGFIAPDIYINAAKKTKEYLDFD